MRIGKHFNSWIVLSLLFLALAPSPTQSTPMAFIGRVRDTTRDNILDMDDDGLLFVADAEGNTAIPLTDIGTDVMHIAWAPAGPRRLAFHAHYTDTDGNRRTDRNDNAGIFVVDFACPTGRLADCDFQTRQLTGSGTDDRYPTWSPDGTKIAFAAQNGAKNTIETINANCALSPLTDQTAGCMDSRQVLLDGDSSYLDINWSPDGRYIAYLALRDTRPDGLLNRLEDHSALYILELSTGTINQLAPADSPKGSPVWSPDGQRLAYYAFTDTDGDGHIDPLYDHAGIFVFDLNSTSPPHRITGPTVHATDPAWSPAARLLSAGSLAIAYSALTDTDGDGWVDAYSDSANIYIVPFKDGAWGMPHALTGAGTLDYTPAWSPDGRCLAYVSIPASDSGGTGSAVNRLGSVQVMGDCENHQISPEKVDAFAPVWAPH